MIVEFQSDYITKTLIPELFLILQAIYESHFRS